MKFAAAVALFSLLAHMRQVNGGLYAAHVASTAAVTVDGQAATQQTDTQGLRFLLRQCSGAVCPGTYFDGERLYGVTINGTALPRPDLADAGMRALRIAGSLDFLSPDFARRGGKIGDGGPVQAGPCNCRRLIVSDPQAAPMEIYVDPHTWLVAGARVAGGPVYAMRDYRRVGSYMLPFLIDRDGTPVEQYTTRSVLATTLQQPQGLSAQFASKPATLQLDPASSTPDAECTIGGITVRCLFDTGNSGLAMSLELAEQLNLNPVGVFNVRGLGSYATEVVRTGPLQIGGARFGDAEYVVLSDIHRYGYDLVLGADVIAVAPMTIDYAHHALSFDVDDLQPDPARTISLIFDNFVPVVDVTLAGQPARLAVDTGDQSTVNLSDEFYSLHPALFKPTRQQNVGGIGGDSVELMGTIGSLQIGPLTTGPQSIGTTKTLKGTANGHLGAGFLANFNVLLDYGRQRMELNPK